MAKKKVYAVRKGWQTGLFDTWDACKQAVEGFSGAEYKSFAAKEEAKQYLTGGIQPSAQDTEALKTVSGQELPHIQGQLIAYVDGSFDKKIGRYSFGCIMITPEGKEIKEFGSGDNPKSLALRNVSGEMLGAMFAVQWAKKNGYQAIDIRYDYAGIEQWATHGWQAKNELTQKYAAYMDKCRENIDITFTKVAAHTGDFYNEEADRLAKDALKHADGIPKIV